MYLGVEELMGRGLAQMRWGHEGRGRVREESRGSSTREYKCKRLPVVGVTAMKKTTQNQSLSTYYSCIPPPELERISKCVMTREKSLWYELLFCCAISHTQSWSGSQSLKWGAVSFNQGLRMALLERVYPRYYGRNMRTHLPDVEGGRREGCGCAQRKWGREVRRKMWHAVGECPTARNSLDERNVYKCTDVSTW